MAKRATRKSMVKSAGEAPLTKADFEAVMGKVFGKFGEIDQRFDKVDQRFDKVDQRFDKERAWAEARFKKTDEKISFEISRQTALLEQIKAEIRTAGEGYSNEAVIREKAITRLHDNLVPRLDSLELVVREHSDELRNKADKSLEARVDALEAASKR